MRAIIAAVVAVAFGAVVGALVIRTQLSPKLEALNSQYAQAEQDNKRLTDQLSFALERTQWLEKENAGLRSQAAAGGGIAPPEADPVGDDVAAGDDASAPPADPSAEGSSSTYQPPDPAEEGKQGSPQDRKLATPEQQMAYAERQMLDNVLEEDMETSADPVERARLQNVIDHRKLVRDLYRDLRDAATPEERQTVLDTILKARSNLKILVKAQQDEMIRRAIESADDTNEQGKQDLVDRLQEIQKSPYFTDPLFVWGMAAPDTPDTQQ